MSLLMLDFDGVLHFASVARINGGPVMLENGYRLFQWIQPLEDILREAPHVRIVLSTSWVAVLGFDRTKSYLPQSIQQRVIGATYHSGYAREHGITKRDWPTLSRFQQIMMYVARNPGQDWIALDDDDDGWPDQQRHYLVHADSELGLSNPVTVKQLRDALAASAPNITKKGTQT